MTDDRFRIRMNEEWARIDAEAHARKDSQSAVFALEEFYRSLSSDERSAANAVLVEWLSDDGKRYDAMALIAEFSVVTALPALRELEARTEHSDQPSAPYDWAKVNRLIAKLSREAPRVR